jgi:hypothetical protein
MYPVLPVDKEERPKDANVEDMYAVLIADVEEKPEEEDVDDI